MDRQAAPPAMLRQATCRALRRHAPPLCLAALAAWALAAGIAVPGCPPVLPGRRPCAVAAGLGGSIYVLLGWPTIPNPIEEAAVWEVRPGSARCVCGRSRMPRRPDYSGLACGRDGSVFFAAGHDLYRIARSGVPEVVARYPHPPPAPLGNEELPAGNGVAVDNQGRIVYLARPEFRLCRVDLRTSHVAVALGKGQAAPEPGVAAVRTRLGAWAVTVSPDGRIYFSSFDRVWRIGSDGSLVAVAAPEMRDGPAPVVNDGELASDAALGTALAMAADGQGNLYLSCQDRGCIRKVDGHGIVSTVGRLGPAAWNGYGKPAVRDEVSFAASLAVNAQGNLLVASELPLCLARVDGRGAISILTGPPRLRWW